MLSENDRKCIIERYHGWYEKYGYSPKSIGWPRGEPEFRYHILTSIAEFKDGETLLDVGCGFGDLYSFLQKYAPSVKYTGIDFNAEFIEVGKKIHPGADLKVGDINGKDLGKFDWVVAYGIFNDRIPEGSNEDVIKTTVQKMFEISNKGISVNFLTTYVEYTDFQSCYVSPEWAFSFAKTLSKRVCLRHDYMAYSFFLYIYKNDEINCEEGNIFKECKENWKKNK